MMQILNGAYVVLAVILLFGAAVFVHEFGHYWMARRRGMKVEAFAIGFGPKILGWNRDGIEYSWRWIPAGGFVKLPQMITSEALEGSSSGVPIPPAAPWSRILVAFAGPAMNVVFAFAVAGVIYFVGLPVPATPPVVGFVEPQSEEAKAGIQDGDVILMVGGKKVKYWEDLQSITILAPTNVLAVMMSRAVPGPDGVTNSVTNTYYLHTKVNEVFGLKMLNLDPRDHPEIHRVLAGGAAAAAGLEAGDEVISVGDIPVVGQSQFVDLIKKRADKPTEIVVKRAGQRKAIQVTPRMDPTTGIGRIGVEVGTKSAGVYRILKPGPSPWAQVTDVWDKTVNTFSALAHSKQTGVGAKDLSGPLGILAMLGAQANADYRLALSFLVLLSINLAIINLLPVPVLDGGHILIALIERVRGRPVSVKLLEYTTTGFAVLLISFMLYVSFFDVKRFPVFKSMFGRGIQIEQPEKPADQPAPAPAR